MRVGGAGTPAGYEFAVGYVHKYKDPRICFFSHYETSIVGVGARKIISNEIGSVGKISELTVESFQVNEGGVFVYFIINENIEYDAVAEISISAGKGFFRDRKKVLLAGRLYGAVFSESDFVEGKNELSLHISIPTNAGTGLKGDGKILVDFAKQEIDVEKSSYENNIAIKNFASNKDRLDRFNRFIRISNWLDLPYDEVDGLITNSSKQPEWTTSTNTLRMMGVFQWYRQRYDISAEQFIAFTGAMRGFSVGSAVPFNVKIFGDTLPAAYDSEWSMSDGAIASFVAAGLKVSEALLSALYDRISSARGGDPLHLNLQDLAALYRLATLPRTFGLSVQEGLALLDLLGGGKVSAALVNPAFADLDGAGKPGAADILDVLSAFSQAAEWLNAHRLSALTVSAWLGESMLPSAGTAEQAAWFAETDRLLSAVLLTEEKIRALGLPSLDSAGGTIDWVEAFRKQRLLDQAYGLIPDAGDPKALLRVRVENVLAALNLENSLKNQLESDLSAFFLSAFLAQADVAASALAKLLGTPQPLSKPLLRWAGSTGDDLLRRIHTTMAGRDDLPPGDISGDDLKLLFNLARVAAIAEQFNLSPAMLEAFLANPGWFGVKDTSLKLTTVYCLSRWSDLLDRLAEGKSESDVLQYLADVNPPQTDTLPGDAPAPKKAKQSPSKDAAPVPMRSRAPAADSAVQRLAGLLAWSAAEVDIAARHATGGTDGAKTLADIDAVMRLQALSRQTGLSAQPLVQVANLHEGSPYADWKQAGDALLAARRAA